MLDINTIEKLDRIATPFYYYDMELFRKTVDHVAVLAEEHDIKVHYAVKANVERRLLEYISSKGFGADCVSGNEVLHAHSCGFPADKIVYAGVGKTDKEIFNALSLGIEAFNCESLQEIYVINEMAHVYGLKANVSVRINPDIDAHTHKYVTTGLYENKFGISQHEFDKLIDIIKKSEHINFYGLHFHIGSQITRVSEVFALECKRVNEIVAYFERNGLRVDNINLGGGLGVDYDDPDENAIADFKTWFETISANILRRKDQAVHVEPGRSLVAQCATLISRVLFVIRLQKLCLQRIMSAQSGIAAADEDVLSAGLFCDLIHNCRNLVMGLCGLLRRETAGIGHHVKEVVLFFEASLDAVVIPVRVDMNIMYGLDAGGVVIQNDDLLVVGSDLFVVGERGLVDRTDGAFIVAGLTHLVDLFRLLVALLFELLVQSGLVLLQLSHFLLDDGFAVLGSLNGGTACFEVGIKSGIDDVDQ